MRHSSEGRDSKNQPSGSSNKFLYTALLRAILSLSHVDVSWQTSNNNSKKSLPPLTLVKSTYTKPEIESRLKKNAVINKQNVQCFLKFRDTLPDKKRAGISAFIEGYGTDQPEVTYAIRLYLDPDGKYGIWKEVLDMKVKYPNTYKRVYLMVQDVILAEPAITLKQ